MGNRSAIATEPLIKLSVEQVDLETDPASEFILHQLVADIERDPLIYFAKIATLVKSYCRKYLEGVLLLDEG